MTSAAPVLEILTNKPVSTKQLVALYDAVGWTAYTSDPRRLTLAVRNSTFVASAWEGEQLIGIARAVSDDVSIAFLKDLLVHPDHRDLGVGRALMAAFLDRFEDVREKVVLSPDPGGQQRLYDEFKFSNVKHLRRTPIDAFVRIEDVRLG